MSPDFIEMVGVTVQGKQVIDYVFSGNHGAHWLVLCLECKAQQIERGTKLRRAQKRPWDYRIVCKGCGI